MLLSVGVDGLAEEGVVPEGLCEDPGDLREFGEARFANLGHGCVEGRVVVDWLMRSKVCCV